MSESIVQTRDELLTELCTFLECAIHNILYTREVYPAGLFKKVKIYNVPIYKCRHPSVCTYIRNIIDSIKPLLIGDLVDKLCLVICRDTPQRDPLEQYTFTLKLLAPFHNCTRASLDTFLRSFLLKINVADGAFLPISPNFNVSFYVLMHTVADLDGDKQRCLQGLLDNPWVDGTQEADGLFRGAEVAPFKTISTQSFQLQLHVEQLIK